jgi:hypothetical protein
MERRTTSIKIDPNLWKDFKKRAIDKDLEISEYLEKLIRKELGR